MTIPENGIWSLRHERDAIAGKVGFPCLGRPPLQVQPPSLSRHRRWSHSANHLLRGSRIHTIHRLTGRRNVLGWCLSDAQCGYGDSWARRNGNRAQSLDATLVGSQEIPHEMEACSVKTPLEPRGSNSRTAPLSAGAASVKRWRLKGVLAASAAAVLLITGFGAPAYAASTASGSFPGVAFNKDLGSAANNIGVRVVQLDDGTLLAGGRFTSFDGETANNVVALNADGTLNTTFNANLGTGDQSTGSGDPLAQAGTTGLFRPLVIAGSVALLAASATVFLLLVSRRRRGELGR